MTVTTGVEETVAELRSATKLLLTTHENPDGDALGSLLGMHLVLSALGKDSLMFMIDAEDGVPLEYRHMPFSKLVSAPPEDLDERTVVFLDCGNIDRMPVHYLQRSRGPVLNIDHHHDNTRFGTVNLVVPEASCTAEIVFDLARELDVEVTRCIAEALYTGLVTDTGRFMYENTTPAAHRMAAALIQAGVSVHDVYRRLFEGLPFARLRLASRALARAERYDGGALTLTYLERRDFEETDAVETDSEGIVDQLRTVEGTAVAALVRELLDAHRAGVRKVSMRSVDGRVDVSRIARAHGGGGHRQAAGFSTQLPLDELIARVRDEVAEQL